MRRQDLVALHRRLGWSGVKLAEHLNVLPQTLYKMEVGVRQIPPELAEKLEALRQEVVQKRTVRAKPPPETHMRNVYLCVASAPKLAAARDRVRRQELLVFRGRAAGWDTSRSEQLLAVFRQSLALLEGAAPALDLMQPAQGVVRVEPDRLRHDEELGQLDLPFAAFKAA